MQISPNNLIRDFKYLCSTRIRDTRRPAVPGPVSMVFYKVYCSSIEVKMLPKAVPRGRFFFGIAGSNRLHHGFDGSVAMESRSDRKSRCLSELLKHDLSCGLARNRLQELSKQAPGRRIIPSLGVFATVG
jgi:hypothetical protein